MIVNGANGRDPDPPGFENEIGPEADQIVEMHDIRSEMFKNGAEPPARSVPVKRSGVFERPDREAVNRDSVERLERHLAADLVRTRRAAGENRDFVTARDEFQRMPMRDQFRPADGHGRVEIRDHQYFQRAPHALRMQAASNRSAPSISRFPLQNIVSTRMDLHRLQPPKPRT